ncbi:MAG: hypothetical protein ACFCGT_19770 [Sandaracinaceae bacterium]
MTGGGGRPARLLACIALAAAALGAPAVAEADDDLAAQLSTRLVTGAGLCIPVGVGRAPGFLYELGLRADLLLGRGRPERVRAGPLVDLRTDGFRSIEPGGGLSLWVPTGRGLGLSLLAGGGYAFRRQGRDGPFALGSVTVAYRPYNYFGAYGWMAGVYAALRVQVDDPRGWEATLGVSLDLALLAVPFLILAQRIRGPGPV